jgi:hypothetical protein
VDVDQEIVDSLNELIELGQEVLNTRRSPARGHITSDFVDVQLANRWLARCSSLLSKVFGEESIHFQSFNRQFNEYPKWSNVQQAFGVLQAAKDDYENGALFDVRKLIEAELFDEFLEQAEYLLSAGYYQPAAVIAGSVLEDGLRKLCKKQQIALPTKPRLDQMNAELAKNGMYNKLIQKKITSLAEVRNRAAHGQWDQFGKADVEDMMRGVRDFMERYYA